MNETPDRPTYVRLDAQQGRDPRDGWRVYRTRQVVIGEDGLRLEARAAAPVPLTDATGTLGGLEEPAGVAVGPGREIYVSDRRTHRIVKLVRREGLAIRAHVFQESDGRARDRFVYVPMANRLERWPGSLGRDPESPAEVEVMGEACSETEARRLVEARLRAAPVAAASCDCTQEAAPPAPAVASGLKEWDRDYPSSLAAGSLCSSSVELLPCLGGRGRAPRQLDEPRGLAVFRHNLYVADSGNHRVQVLDLRTMALRAVWGRRGPAGHVAGTGPGQFDEPWDVAAGPDGAVAVADKGNHRVQVWRPRTRRFAVVDGTRVAARVFQVLYGPGTGDRLVYVPLHHRLELWPGGREPSTAADALPVAAGLRTPAEARERALAAIGAAGVRDILLEWDQDYPRHLGGGPTAFQSPTNLAVDRAGRLYVVDEARDDVLVLDGEGRVVEQVRVVDDARERFPPVAVSVDPLGRLLVATEGGLLRYLPAEEGMGPPTRVGTWSRLCVAVAADAEAGVLVAGGSTVTALPPPAGLVRAGDVLSRPLDSGRESCAWHRVELDLVRPLPLGTTVIVSTYTDDEARPAEEIEALDAGEWRAGPAGADDFLVLSGPGRYLWLKLELRGNASDTPVVRGMRVHFPRQGYLQYLPAVYQADPVSRDFLGRFLSIFETVLASVEARVEDLPRYLDPDGVPPEFLAWLAGWIDLSFERGWSTAVRRRLLRSAPDLYRRRGTAEGLRRLLKIVIGADVRLLEHYRARRWVSLGGAALGGRTELGGTCRAPRLQLEENSRIGDFSLIGPGDPRRDPFASHAHRFSVFVPGRRLRPESSARRLRALIDGAKPAHTQFEVVPVEPRFRVGVQATLGLDAVVGAYPRLVLNRCATLGHDSRLGCAAGATGPPVVRVGARRACAHALAG